MRERLPVLAGAAVGLVAAIVLTVLQTSVYRADASIALVRQGQPPGDDPALARAAEAAAELFDSRAVAEPAIANLRLEESPDELIDRVSVEAEAESSLIRVSVDAPTRDEARRTAQELVEVGTVLYNDRFGPAISASIWETPRVQSGRVAPRPARNLALGLLLGALVGCVVGARRRLLPPREAARPAPQPDRAALRERAPEAAFAPLPEAAPVDAPASAPEAVPEAAPVPEAVHAVAPEPELAAPFVPPRFGEWTIADVERVLTEQGPAFPDRAEELGFYLDSFRDVARPDGRLPAGVEGLLEDVFGELIERARR